MIRAIWRKWCAFRARGLADLQQGNFYRGGPRRITPEQHDYLSTLGMMVTSDDPTNDIHRAYELGRAEERSKWQVERKQLIARQGAPDSPSIIYNEMPISEELTELIRDGKLQLGPIEVKRTDRSVVVDALRSMTPIERIELLRDAGIDCDNAPLAHNEMPIEIPVPGKEPWTKVQEAFERDRREKSGDEMLGDDKAAMKREAASRFRATTKYTPANVGAAPAPADYANNQPMGVTARVEEEFRTPTSHQRRRDDRRDDAPFIPASDVTHVDCSPASNSCGSCGGGE